MKQRFTILLILLIALTSFAQQGINYKALIKDDLGNVVANNNAVTVQFIIYEGSDLTNNVYQETHTTLSDNNGLIAVNIGTGTTSDDFTGINWGNEDHFLEVQIDIGNGLVSLGTTQFMAVPYALNVTGLERITERINRTGWRLLGRDPEFYGDIGSNAIDFSSSSTYSDVLGATGAGSIATGFQTESSGDYSVALGFETKATQTSSVAIGSRAEATGRTSASIGDNLFARSKSEIALGSFNTDYSFNSNSQWNDQDRILAIGNGEDENNRSDALIILKNGTITAPSFDISEITDGKSLVTKEYIDNVLPESPSGLELITEDNQTGWRLVGESFGNHGIIGSDAMDLSISNLLGRGATGSFSVALGNNSLASETHSVAIGFNAEASDISALAFGEESTASGQRSIAIGFSATATDYASTAIGIGCTASNSGSLAMGSSTTASGIVSTTFGEMTIASGRYSTAMGLETLAPSYAETVVGLFNTVYSPIDTNAFWQNDRLFVIGNGIDNSNRNDALTVLKSGNTGINTSFPSSLFEVSHGNTAPTSINRSNALSVRNNSALRSWQFFTSGSGNLLLYSDGLYRGLFNATSGAYVVGSDRRIKKDISSLEDNTLNKVLQLNPVSYLMKNQKDDKRTIGLISQEVQQLFPSLTHYVKEHDLLALSYTELIPVLIKAIQEQQEIIDTQNENYKALLSRVEALEQAKSN